MPDDPKCKQIYDYFQRKWIKTRNPELWNHYDSLTRTNYRVEGFHSSINKLLPNPHPNLYVLIDFLKQQQCCTLLSYLRCQQRIYARKPPVKDGKNLILELFKVKYNSSLNFSEFFRGLNYYIQYPNDKIIELDIRDERYDIEDDFVTTIASITFEKNDESILPDLNWKNRSNENENTIETVYVSDILHSASTVLYEADSQSDQNQPTTSYAVSSSGSSIAITKRGILADLVKEIQDEIDDDSFDYVKNNINYESVQQVFARNRAQTEFVESAVSRRAIF
ncbi:unnamed protein product [Brachionus calyciflorus]|uniref:MULE transposase domain-containing protein n=1 Tax=Brachionus calyciflorus TaxID=104777 RepID=A0A814LIX9_9BILA|nr:unnamed protein product [Brachionus calyciflorus]